MAKPSSRYRLIYLAHPYGSGCAYLRGRTKDEIRKAATRRG